MLDFRRAGYGGCDGVTSGSGQSGHGQRCARRAREARPGVFGPRLPARLPRSAAGGRAGRAVLAAPRFPGSVAGVSATDRRRVPQVGRLVRRGQSHSGGAAEVHRPQHRGDGAPSASGGAHRAFAGGRDRGGAGTAAGVHLPPARHRSVQASAVLLRQEGPPRDGVLLLPVGHRFRTRLHQGFAPTARGRSRSGSTATNGPNAKPRRLVWASPSCPTGSPLARIPMRCRRSATDCGRAPSRCSSNAGWPGCRCR